MTQILPSPILPVRGRRLTASIDEIDLPVVDDHLDLDLGDEVDLVLGAAVRLGVAALAAEAADLADGHPVTPIALRASFTSSSLNGLTIAVMSFMFRCLPAASSGRTRGRRGRPSRACRGRRSRPLPWSGCRPWARDLSWILKNAKAMPKITVQITTTPSSWAPSWPTVALDQMPFDAVAGSPVVPFQPAP